MKIAYVDTRELEPNCQPSAALLRYAAADWGISDYTVRKNLWGKPSLENQPGFHYNITHSGHFAAIAWGETEVGIDLEVIRQRERIPALVRRHFTVPEQKYVFAQDTLARFYQVWTAKESCLKYLGTGLAKPLSSVCTRSPQWQALLHGFFPEPDFCLTVCTEEPCEDPVRLAADDLRI